MIRQLIVTIELEHTCCYDGTGPTAVCGCLNTAKNVITGQILDDVADKVLTSCTDGNGDCHVAIKDVFVLHNIVPEDSKNDLHKEMNHE